MREGAAGKQVEKTTDFKANTELAEARPRGSTDSRVSIKSDKSVRIIYLK